MTVKELIEKLKQFDENIVVVIDDSCLKDNRDDVHDVTLQQFTVFDKDGNRTKIGIDQVVIY